MKNKKLLIAGAGLVALVLIIVVASSGDSSLFQGRLEGVGTAPRKIAVKTNKNNKQQEKKQPPQEKQIATVSIVSLSPIAFDLASNNNQTLNFKAELNGVSTDGQNYSTIVRILDGEKSVIGWSKDTTGSTIFDSNDNGGVNMGTAKEFFKKTGTFKTEVAVYHPPENNTPILHAAGPDIVVTDSTPLKPAPDCNSIALSSDTSVITQLQKDKITISGVPSECKPVITYLFTPETQYAEKFGFVYNNNLNNLTSTFDNTVNEFLSYDDKGNLIINPSKSLRNSPPYIFQGPLVWKAKQNSSKMKLEAQINQITISSLEFEVTLPVGVGPLYNVVTKQWLNDGEEMHVGDQYTFAYSESSKFCSDCGEWKVSWAVVNDNQQWEKMVSLDPNTPFTIAEDNKQITTTLNFNTKDGKQAIINVTGFTNPVASTKEGEFGIIVQGGKSKS